MEPTSVIHSTFVIERTYPVTPERAFAAFADPEQKRRWYVTGDNHEIEHYELDFRVGGKEHARLRFNQGTPLAGKSYTNDIGYLDIVPDRRIVFAAAMVIGGKCVSATLATVEFLPSEDGTDLVFTHQGVFFEGSGGPQMREAGWRKLLSRLI